MFLYHLLGGKNHKKRKTLEENNSTKLTEQLSPSWACRLSLPNRRQGWRSCDDIYFGKGSVRRGLLKPGNRFDEREKEMPRWYCRLVLVCLLFWQLQTDAYFCKRVLLGEHLGIVWKTLERCLWWKRGGKARKGYLVRGERERERDMCGSESTGGKGCDSDSGNGAYCALKFREKLSVSCGVYSCRLSFGATERGMKSE